MQKKRNPRIIKTTYAELAKIVNYCKEYEEVVPDIAKIELVIEQRKIIKANVSYTPKTDPVNFSIGI